MTGLQIVFYLLSMSIMFQLNFLPKARLNIFLYSTIKNYLRNNQKELLFLQVFDRKKYEKYLYPLFKAHINQVISLVYDITVDHLF